MRPTVQHSKHTMTQIIPPRLHRPQDQPGVSSANVSPRPPRLPPSHLPLTPHLLHPPPLVSIDLCGPPLSVGQGTPLLPHRSSIKSVKRQRVSLEFPSTTVWSPHLPMPLTQLTRVSVTRDFWDLSGAPRSTPLRSAWEVEQTTASPPSFLGVLECRVLLH